VNSTETKMKDSDPPLLPHQAALVDTVLNPASKRTIVLCGDVGLGKSAALIAVAKRLLHEQPAARALVLVPKAMQRQFVEMLHGADTPTLLVDRYQFRKMLDSTAEEEIWPRGVVAVLSKDFARQPDIRESLARSSWELLIVDEAHSNRADHAETLKRIGASAKRVVLATAMLSGLERTNIFSNEDTTIVKWNRDQIVDRDGKLLDTAPRPILHQVHFSLSPNELVFQEEINILCSALEKTVQPQGQISNSIVRRFRSSLPAGESMLRTILGRLLAVVASKQPLEIVAEIDFEEVLKLRFHPANAIEASQIARQALEHIEKISIDSKLDELTALIRRITETKTSSQRICIVTNYFATLWYLNAHLEFEGIHNVLLCGDVLTVEDYNRSLAAFANGEGVLVTTRADMTDEVDLSETTDLVLYDELDGNDALRQVLAPFEQIGRKSQLNVHALVPTAPPIVN
jgi:hypothetical protein